VTTPSPQPASPVSLHAFVRGRVQGVGFRYFVIEAGQRRDLVGWVRNLDSGEVEVWAEGLRPVLEELLAELHTGPRLARVQSVTAQWAPATGRHRRFSAVSSSW
jgi:acylphosphatase